MSKIYETNDEYDFYFSEWEKARDFTHSEKKVKSGGEKYIPRLRGNDDNEYQTYLSFGSLSMFAKKVLMSYIGMVQRKQYTITHPDIIYDTKYPITPNKKTLYRFITDVLYNRFLFGRVGILVDYIDADERSYMFLYDTFSILEVKYDVYGNLNKVVLTQSDNTLLKLELIDGVYTQQKFDIETEEPVTELITPIKNGNTFDYIPFVIMGDYIPFITEIIDLNYHHFRLSVDLQYALHWVGIPTPTVTGITNEEDVPDFIGTSKYISIPDPNGKAFFMEFEGKGLDSIKDRMEDIRNDIASLSINLILNDQFTSKTATQSIIDNNNSSSSLAGVVKDISADLTTIFNIMMDWNIMETEFVIKLNTDFVASKMDPQLLRELTNMLLSGTISYETYWKALQDGELVDSDKSAEEEKTNIETQPLI